MIYVKESMENESSVDLSYSIWVALRSRDENRFNLEMSFQIEKDRKKDLTSGYWDRILHMRFSKEEAYRILDSYESDLKEIQDSLKNLLAEIGEASRTSVTSAVHKHLLMKSELFERYKSKYGGDENEN